MRQQGQTPARPAVEFSDGELLAEYRARRAAEAFAQVVTRHRAMVFRTCLRILGNQHDAEDAAQAVFLVLARRPDLLVRGTLAGWLHLVARRAAIDLLRSRTQRARREAEVAQVQSIRPVSDQDQLREE